MDFSKSTLINIADMEKIFKSLQSLVTDLSGQINQSTLYSENIYKKLYKEKESVPLSFKSHPNWDVRKSASFFRNRS